MRGVDDNIAGHNGGGRGINIRNIQNCNVTGQLRQGTRPAADRQSMAALFVEPPDEGPSHFSCRAEHHDARVSNFTHNVLEVLFLFNENAAVQCTSIQHWNNVRLHHCLDPLELTVTEAAAGLVVSRKQLSGIVNGRAAFPRKW